MKLTARHILILTAILACVPLARPALAQSNIGTVVTPPPDDGDGNNGEGGCDTSQGCNPNLVDGDQQDDTTNVLNIPLNKLNLRPQAPTNIYLKTPVLDQNQAKVAILQGKAATMPLLLAFLKLHYPGDVVDVRLHSASPGYVYEVRYLQKMVVLKTVFLDARTLQLK
jgi:hypothetical protein